jgi:hypothetical protein
MCSLCIYIWVRLAGRERASDERERREWV